jgi:hypothetical protein
MSDWQKYLGWAVFDKERCLVASSPAGGRLFLFANEEAANAAKFALNEKDSTRAPHEVKQIEIKVRS